MAIQPSTAQLPTFSAEKLSAEFFSRACTLDTVALKVPIYAVFRRFFSAENINFFTRVKLV